MYCEFGINLFNQLSTFQIPNAACGKKYLSQIHFSFSIIRILTKSPFVKSQNQLNLYFIQILFLLINPSHPLPPERKNAIAPGIRLFHQNLSFILLESTCPLGQTPPPLLGPILIILHNFAPSGPHLASLVAQFCICGPRRQPHSASQGIRGPLWASSGLVTSSKGTFLFIAINYQLSRKRISPQEKVFVPKSLFFFNYQPCRGISESEVLNQKRILN